MEKQRAMRNTALTSAPEKKKNEKKIRENFHAKKNFFLHDPEKWFLNNDRNRGTTIH